MKQLLALFTFLGGTLVLVLVAGGILTMQHMQLANGRGAVEEVVEETPAAQIPAPSRDVPVTWADVTWTVVESQNNAWDFTVPDAAVAAAGGDVVVRVFANERPSGAPPWEEAPTDFAFGTEAKDYLATVIDRYGDKVRYWQIGNAMDAWGEGAVFSVEAQALFLRDVAQFIRDRDADAVIVLPGVRELNAYSIDVWLPQMLAGDANWFDVVAYAYTGDWKQFAGQHDVLLATLAIGGADDKGVWLTDVRAVDATEAFKIVVQAYGRGDDLVRWSVPVPLAEDIFRFTSVEEVAHSLSEKNLYRFNVENGSAYIAWGAGLMIVPQGMDQYIPVHFDTEEHGWSAVPRDRVLELSDRPLLLTP